MPECKYCGYEISLITLMKGKVLTGSFPECPDCGADDDTLEIK